MGCGPDTARWRFGVADWRLRPDEFRCSRAADQLAIDRHWKRAQWVVRGSDRLGDRGVRLLWLSRGWAAASVGAPGATRAAIGHRECYRAAAPPDAIRASFRGERHQGSP